MLDMNFRRNILKRFTRNSAVIDELLDYNRNHFSTKALRRPLCLPPDDEPSVGIWTAYKKESEEKDALSALQTHLPQFHFPIREGVSKTDKYRAAVLQGKPIPEVSETDPIVFDNPEALELCIHQTPAGRIPLIISCERSDFVRLVQALAGKNEPISVPDSMGALTIGNYSNWERIRQLKAEWQQNNPLDFTGEGWNARFKEIQQDKSLYQDRFILLSNGPYSAVCAHDAGFSESEWQENSLIIRRDHECTHFFTRRILGSMKNRLMDELMADYMGICGALGTYDAELFLRFMGLENHPEYRSGGRLENYRGEAPLSENAFRVLQELAVRSAKSLEAVHTSLTNNLTTFNQRIILVAAMSLLSIEELASEDGTARLENAYGSVKKTIRFSGNVSFA